MRKPMLLLFVFQFALLLSGKAQTGIYKTYDDYVKRAEEKMSDDVKATTTVIMMVKTVNITFVTLSGDKVKYKPKDFWGFIYKGNLFRSDGRGDIVSLIDSTNIYFYQNGYAKINQINTGADKGVFLEGYSYYLSNDINSPLCPLPILCQGCRNGAGVAPGIFYKKFKDEYPEHQDLYDCFDDSQMWTRIACITDYQKKKKKTKK